MRRCLRGLFPERFPTQNIGTRKARKRSFPRPQYFWRTGAATSAEASEGNGVEMRERRAFALVQSWSLLRFRARGCDSLRHVQGIFCDCEEPAHAGRNQSPGFD